MPDPLDGLDASQREAVTHTGGPLLASGGAGTGKTHALRARFEWLVAEGAAPDAILVLTASEPAAAAMRKRFEAAIAVPYEELAVFTPRSFCARLLQDEAIEAGLDPLFAVVGEADRLALLLESFDELTLRRHEIRGTPGPLLAGFVRRIDRLKEEMVGAADCLAAAVRLSEQAGTDLERARAERELEFARVYQDHDRLLARRGALDFGDLVVHAFGLLRDRPHVRRRIAERYPHVLVDDYHELNHAEALLLRVLSQDHTSFWAAADAEQAGDEAAADRVGRFERELSEASGGSAAKVLRLRKRHRWGRRKLRFWRCTTERAQAQAVAAEAERLITDRDTPAEQICVLVRSVREEGPVVAAALEEQGVPCRVAGAAAYFQRVEVRDLLAWLRLLADPGDAGAVVRALTRPPVGMRSVDIARLTQLSRRRRLDMVAGVRAACEGPQLSPEGQEHARSFLRLYRAASSAFDEMRPDAFVHRLVDRLDMRKRQLFAPQGDTLERLVNIAKMGELAAAYARREPRASAREFTRYIAAVADAGLSEDEAAPPSLPSAVQVMAIEASRGLEWDHVLVLSLEREADRRLLQVATTRARKGLVLAWAAHGDSPRPSAFYEEMRSAAGTEEELFEEELFGPAEGLHSTFRMMRDELLDSVSRVGGRLGEMRLDTYLDVSTSVVRYMELLKLAALIERTKEGQSVADALPEVNDLLMQAATPEQRELFHASALDEYLRDTERDERRRARAIGAGVEPSLDAFIPRRGQGLMLSASDIETYRLCPLKYKYARVYRIPQEPTINQRFGIVVHQVLERFHVSGGGSLDQLMGLFDAAWRRGGFGDSSDDLQFREKAVAALRRYWELDQERESEPVSFERSFSFKLGPHLLRGRVDRVDRHPDGSHELIDYKTGRPKSAEELREDVQLSLYQMGAQESWELETSAQSYYYVLDNERVPVAHSEEELDRVRSAVAAIADGVLAQDFQPKPSPEICSVCDYRIICPAAEK